MSYVAGDFINVPLHDLFPDLFPNVEDCSDGLEPVPFTISAIECGLRVSQARNRHEFRAEMAIARKARR